MNSSSREDEKMALRWGVIGAGGIAMRRTIPEGILAAPDAQLAAVMDVDGDRARSVTRKFGDVPWFTSVDDLLHSGEAEAVYIATPNYVHLEQAEAAVEAGLHALVEKPVGIDRGRAVKVREKALRRGVKLGVGFMMRHHGAHKKIQRMVADGDLGTPVMGRAQLSCWYPPIEGAWRQKPELAGGGAFVDLGTHCLDVLEMFLGRAVEVSAFTGRLVHDYDSEDTVVLTARFESGALGMVDSLFGVPDEASKNVLEVYGSRGSVRCEGTIGQAPSGRVRATLLESAGGYDARQEREPAPEKEIEYEKVNTYMAEIQDFCNAVEEDREPAVSFRDGIHALRVTEAVYSSARLGVSVRVQ